MLVIISDLHLSDGTTGSTIPAGAFEIFAERLKLLAQGASHRSDGSYRPMERIDVLLLGDVLDVIRSSRWLADGEVRPWHDSQRPDFVDMVTNITSDILRHNDEALRIMRGFSRDDSITLPPADARGRAVFSAEEEPVPVQVHYMVGNHDWFYHLPGGHYDVLRQGLIAQMGLANQNPRPFAHDAAESEPLLEVLRRHRVVARHGDIFDPFNFEGDRDTSSLGDAVVIELVNRFAAEVGSQMADDLPLGTVQGLLEIDNVRPLVLIPVWLDGLLEHTCVAPPLRRQVKTIWDRLADEFLELAFVRARDGWSPVDMVDGLQRALKFSKQVSISWASSITSWLHGLGGRGDASYVHHALAEQDFRNRRAKHIVYGHTHQVEQISLDASSAEGFVLQQTYFNSGTWRRVHRQTRQNPSQREFMATDEMTYIAFFQGDERRGRPYETWSGTLGVSPSESTIHRIDAVPNNNAPGQPVPTSRIHRHSPHFSPSSARAPIIPTRRV